MEINLAQVLLEDSSPIKCGCYIRNPHALGLQFNKALVPLRHIEYHLEIVNSLLSITLNQKYYNPTDKFLEVDYSLPINPNSSIYKFQAEFNNVRIEGIVKEKEAAKKQYNEAKSQGKQVAMGTLDADSKDILNMEIGNIPPKTQFTITISMLQEIKTSLNTFYKVQIPSTISPRFMNKVEGIAKIGEHQKNEGISSNKPDFDWSFKIDMRTTHKLVFFDSPSHNITLLNQNQTGTQTLIVMQKSQVPNKDFSFVYTTQNFHLPAYVLGNTDVSSTVMLSFIPKFCGLNISDAYKASIENKPLQTDMSSARGDYIFFLDRSGSMGGTRIQKAKQALVLFLKSLPEDSYFNIISFGDGSKRMFNKSTRYAAAEIEKAIKEVQKMSADMGGTEIYDPLQSLLNQKVQEGYPRQVFLLTDGGVSNTEGVIKMVKKSTKYCRVHCIGIGNGASYSLIQGCAENGKGKFIMISDNQNPAAKIIQLLESTLTPLISKVSLTTKNDSQIESIVPNPKSIPYILKDDVINFYITFKGSLEHQTKFSFEYEDSVTKLPYKTEIQIDPKSLNFPFVDKMSHLKVLRTLQNSANEGVAIDDQMYYVKIKDFKEEAIKYSVKHQVLSEFTAFICVGKQLKDGQYQQFLNSAVEKVHVEQPKPIQKQQQVFMPYSYAVPCSAPVIQCSAPRNYSGLMMEKCMAPTSNMRMMDSMDRCDKLQQLSYQTQNLKMCSSSFSKSSKKKSSGINLGIGNFFSSIGQKISNIFTSEKAEQTKESYRQSEKASESRSIPQIQSKKDMDAILISDSKTISLGGKKENLVAYDINSIIKLQAPNGSWNQNGLIDKLSKTPKQIHDLCKKLGAQLVITQLVINWIQKNHNDKQYALIIKKAQAWAKKYCSEKGIAEQELNLIQSK